MRKKIGLFLCICVTVGIVGFGCSKKTEEVTDPLTATVTPQITENLQNTVTPQITENLQVTVTPQPEGGENDKKQGSTITGSVSEDDWKETQKKAILQKKTEYEKSVIYEFDLNSTNVIFIESPKANKEEYVDYFGDLWIYGDGWSELVQENAYILPDTFGIEKINDVDCFRYDLSYVTASVTCLLMNDINGTYHLIQLPGALVEESGSYLKVTISAYDMVYIKEENYACGHTWKPHYLYLEGYEVYEDPVYSMSEEEFLTYKTSQAILDRIREEYAAPDKKVNLLFMQRDNGLIHINIMVDGPADITYYYETYSIDTEFGALDFIESGEGTYANIDPQDGEETSSMGVWDTIYSLYGEMDETKLVYLKEYSEENHTITVQEAEWLTPWSDEDKDRIQELIDAGKIDKDSGIWDYEYYIYSDPVEVRLAAYSLESNPIIAFWDENVILRYYGEKKLKELSEYSEPGIYKLVYLELKDKKVCGIVEPYRP